MPNNRKFGEQHEALAADYLVRKGYFLVMQNFHWGQQGEIDIVCKDGETYVFVEVKTRTKHDHGTPEESVNPRKRATIKRIAAGFLYVNKIVEADCRFDVVAVDYVTGNPEIRHWVNAFS